MGNISGPILLDGFNGAAAIIYLWFSTTRTSSTKPTAGGCVASVLYPYLLLQVWMGATFIGMYFLLHRYYFFGKHTAMAQRSVAPEEWQKRADDNKRDWGYNSFYKPTLPISYKLKIQEVMGGNHTLLTQTATTTRCPTPRSSCILAGPSRKSSHRRTIIDINVLNRNKILKIPTAYAACR